MATRNISTKLSITGESEYRSALSKINTELKTLQSSLKLTQSQYQTNANSLEALRAKHDALAKVQEAQKKKVDELKNALTNAQKAQAEWTDKIASTKQKLSDNEAALEKLKKATGDTAAEQKRLTEEGEKLREQLSREEAGLASAEKGAHSWQQQLNNAQIQLNNLDAELQKNDQYLDEAAKSADGCAHSIDEFGREVHEASEESKTLATVLSSQELKEGMDRIVSTLADCVSAFADYQAGLAKVRSTTGMSQEEVEQLGNRFKELSTQIPLTTDEMLRIAAAAGQFGIKNADIESFTVSMARLASASDTTADSVASLLAQFSNITGEKDFERLASVITRLNYNSATSAESIIQMSQGLAAAGKVAGMSAQDILAISASVTSLGQGSQAGATAMQRLIIEMQKSVETGDKLDQFASISGMSAREFRKAWGEDAVGALAAFVEGLADTDRNGKSALALFDDLGISQQKEITTLTGLAAAELSLSDAVEMVNDEWQQNTALTEAAAIKGETLQAKLDELDNASYNLKTAVGEALAPALTKAAAGATDLVQGVAGFVQEHPQLTRALSVTAGGLATVTTGIATAKAAWKAADFLGMTAPLKKVAEAAATAGGGLSGLGAALGTVATTGGIAGTALLSVVTIAKRCSDIQTVGFLGEGHTLEEYAENVENYKKQLEELQAEYENLVQYGGDLSMITDQQSMATIGLENATNEYMDALHQLGQTEETVAADTEGLSEAYSSQKYTLEDAKFELGDIAQAYADALEAAQTSLGGQIGLFDNYAKVIGEDTDTAEKLLKIWGEKTQNLGEYTQDLQKAAALGIDEGLLKTLADGSPEAAGYLATILEEVQKADEGLSQFGGNAAEVVETFNDAFKQTEEAQENLATTMAAINTGVVDALAQIKMTLGEDTTFDDYYATVCEVFANAGVDFTTYGNNMMFGLIGGVSEQQAAAVQSVLDVAQGQNQAFETENGIHSPSTRYHDYGVNMVQGLINGISASSPAAVEVIRSLAQQMRSEVSGLPYEMQSIGEQIVNGMIQGLENRESALYRKIRAIVASAIAAAKAAASVESPSKKTKEIFEYVGEGMIVGIESKAKKVNEATKNVVEQAISFDQSSIRQLSGSIASSIPNFDLLLGRGRKAYNSGEKNGSSQNTTVNNNFSFTITTQPGQNNKEIAEYVMDYIITEVDKERSRFN